MVVALEADLVAQVRRMAFEGRSVQAIARAIGQGQGAVYSVLRQHPVTDVPPELREGKPGEPHPLPAPPASGEVEPDRDLDCIHDRECSLLAARRNWPGFRCSGCKLRGCADVDRAVELEELARRRRDGDEALETTPVPVAAPEVGARVLELLRGGPVRCVEVARRLELDRETAGKVLERLRRAGRVWVVGDLYHLAGPKAAAQKAAAPAQVASTRRPDPAARLHRGSIPWMLVALLRAEPSRAWAIPELRESLERNGKTANALDQALCRLVRDGVIERVGIGTYRAA
jgi:hypothetical protein